YYFGSNIQNLENVLTINEGVTIYMAGNTDFISATSPQSGRLEINGTAAKPVLFTRLPNSSYYWGKIYFRGLKGSVINNCVFEYGGCSGLYSSCIIEFVESTELTLNNVELNNSDTYGVYVDDSCNGYILTHNNVTFHNNRLGNVCHPCSGGVFPDFE
ncbi:MAG: hypothetical protein FWD66_09425, partial [Paludibacter sp.]|nr:hypothetical protein [Paludibacter sp.]